MVRQAFTWTRRRLAPCSRFTWDITHSLDNQQRRPYQSEEIKFLAYFLEIVRITEIVVDAVQIETSDSYGISEELTKIDR